jgi:Zn-dependent protease
MTVYEASTWMIPVIIAITFHEAAHGFVALLFGDGTAWRLGRVSFNPLRHIDARVASLAAFAVPFRLRQAGSG